MKSQIPNFKQYLISLSKSPNTIRNYTADVTHYFEMFDIINRENILKYKEKISGLATTTINCKLSSLKSFNEYLLSQNLVKSIFVLKQDFIKRQSVGNPTNITEKQVAKFLKRVNEKDHIYKSRNIAIIYLIANTGIRREEVTNLLLKNLDLEKGKMIVIGKGNKERIVYLNADAIMVLKDWLKDRSKFKHAATSSYIFVSERAEKLHKDSINDIFNFYCTPKCKIKPHGLRHNYGSTWAEKGKSLSILQNQLGHSSLAVTSIYTIPREDSIKKIVDDFKIG